MLPTLLILTSLVAIFWLLLALLPSQRYAARYVYNDTDSPDKLNNSFPNDDTTGPFVGDPLQWPTVTVIVPGRNEGHHLAKTLGSLCSMDYPNYRVIFIDDQSTDNTRPVCDELRAKHANLTVIHNTTPPSPGWIGKTWAVHQAASYMQEGDYLLFTDSDLNFHPQCLKQMVRLALHRRTDITSCLPQLRYESLGELLGLIAAMVLINLHVSLYTSNNPKTKKALVAGGFLLAKRTSYQELGGHEAVRGQVVEDVALGTLAKTKGYRVFTATTHDLILARMYEGLRDTFHGLKKNAYAGANYNPLTAIVAILFILFFAALLPVYKLVALYLWITQTSLLTFAILLAAILISVGMRTAARRGNRTVGIPERHAWLAPFGFAFYLIVFLASLFEHHHRGGNTWSGRRIDPADVQTLAEAEKPATKV